MDVGGGRMLEYSKRGRKEPPGARLPRRRRAPRGGEPLKKIATDVDFEMDGAVDPLSACGSMHIPTPSNPVPTCLRPPGALGASENEEGAPSELPSLRSLVRRHARFVGRLAAETGVRSGDVDDVVQAVLLIAWHHLRRGGELPQAKAWLRTVTKRVAWAHNRAVLARAELLVGDMPGEGMGYPEDLLAPSAEEVHESMAAIQLVREVVARLRPERRVVFVRYELDGESVVEIAADLGILLNTAYDRLRLAREDFRRILKARLRRDERRRAVLLPFLFQRSELSAGGRGRATAGALLCALLALLVLDTRWVPVVPSQEDVTSFAAVPREGPAIAPGEAELPPAPGLPSSPGPAAFEAPPATTPPASGPPAATGASPARPAKRGGPGSPRPMEATTSRPPRKRRNLETARILLDTADRMAAEGLADAAEEALRSYSVHAPDDPMPATRAAVRLPGTQATTAGPRTASTVAPSLGRPAPAPPSPSTPLPQPPPAR